MVFLPKIIGKRNCSDTFTDNSAFGSFLAGGLLRYHKGRLGMCIVALLLGHILFSLIFAIIGFTAFIFVEVWALRRLLEDTVQFLSGALLPIALFPDPLKKIAEILPFHYLYDFPLQLLLKEEVAQTTIISIFLGIIAWIGVFGLLLYVVYKLSVRFCVVQGG